MITHRCAIVGCGLLIVATNHAAAQGLSLDEAIDAAQRSNFGVTAAGEGVAAAAGGLRLARAEHYPTLNLSAGYSQYDGKVLFGRFIPGAPGDGETDVGSFNTNTGAQLQLSQPLYAGGANRAGVSAARLEQQLAASELEQARLDLAYRVTEAYYGALVAEREVEVAERGLRRSQESLDHVRLRFEEGEALQVEVLGAENQLEADRLAATESANRLAMARLVFNQLLARAPDAAVELTDALEAPPPAAVESGAVDRVLASSPQLKASALGRDRAEAASARASALKKLKVGLNGFYSYIDNELFFKGSNYGLSLDVSIPFAKDITAGGGAVARAEAGRRSADNSHRELESALRVQAEQALHAIQEARQAIRAAEKNLEFNQERYRITRSAYQEQLATFSDVLDDHTELFEAELVLLQTHYRARLAEAELDRLMGQGG